MRVFIAIGLVAMSLLSACGGSLPSYPLMSDAAALAVVAERQALVTTISAECDLRLTDAQGQTVRLEGVILAKPPGSIRLRAWKFGHAVFDLTLVDGKGWIVSPDANRQRFNIEALPARNVREAFDLLGPAYFRAATPSGRDSRVLIVRGPALGLEDVECEIIRRTLTPRRFVVHSDATEAPSELVLDQYSVEGGIVWPLRMTLRGPMGEVRIRLRDVELNGEMPEEAFVPPQRARELP